MTAIFPASTNGWRLEPVDAGELVLDLGIAHVAIDRTLELHAAAVGAAIVDRKYDPAPIDECFVQRQRLVPFVRNLLPVRAAIDVPEHGVALPRLQLRREHPVMELRPVRPGDASEGRDFMAVEVGRIRVRRIERVLLDPGEALAVGIGKVGLRWLHRIGPADERMRRALVHHGIVVPAALGHAQRRAGPL